MSVRAEIQQYVKRVRRDRTCKGCNRQVRSAFLGGEGRPLSDLVYSPGVTVEMVKEEIESRGWVCRSCLDRGGQGVPEPVQTGPSVLEAQLAILDKLKAEREAERSSHHHHGGKSDATP